MTSERAVGGEMEIRPAMLARQDGDIAWPDFGKTRMLTCDTGRSAFYLALQHWRTVRPGASGTVWLPEYICHSMLETVLDAGLPYAYYCDLPGSASLTTTPTPEDDDLVVIVHYFGMINRAAQSWLDSVPGRGWKLLEDCVQAPYSEGVGRTGDYAIVSLRKWWPVPDGAALYLNAEAYPVELSPADEGFVGQRLAAQLLRATGQAEACYLGWIHDSEEKLQYAVPRHCSWISRHLLSGVELQAAKRRRVDNWRCMDRWFGDGGEMRLGAIRLFDELAEGAVPLTYPIRVKDGRRDRLRASLAERRIYCPIHWPLHPSASKVSRQVSEEILGIPIDQRYGDRDMDRVIRALNDDAREDRDEA